MLALCEAALEDLRTVGCEVDAHRVPFDGERLWRIWLAHRHLMVGGQFQALLQDPAKRALVKPALVWEVEGLSGMTAQQVYQASTERSAWYQTVLAMFEEFDYLAVPTAQVFPFDAELDWPKRIADRDMDTYHRWMEVVTPWTLSGCPVISVPAGFGQAGLPAGLQLIGRPRATSTCCGWPMLTGRRGTGCRPGRRRRSGPVERRENRGRTAGFGTV